MRNVPTGTEVAEATGKAEAAPREVGREASKASQRPRIIEALIEPVADHGYAGTSIREIARVAGVSLSTFYEHFDDKEECFLAAYDQVADKLMEDIGAVTPQSRTPRVGPAVSDTAARRGAATEAVCTRPLASLSCSRRRSRSASGVRPGPVCFS